jgi:hypothetical protein
VLVVWLGLASCLPDLVYRVAKEQPTCFYNLDQVIVVLDACVVH